MFDHQTNQPALLKILSLNLFKEIKMEKKPIKRSPYIIKLSRDHHASLLFCWKLRQGEKNAIEKERMKKYVAYFFEEHLKPHFREEEEFLFSSAKNDAVVLRAMDEHKNINQLASKIIDSDSENLTAEFTAIADMVDQHVRFEERELFPHMEELLSEKQLIEISEKLGQAPEKDVFEDEFWVRKKN